MNNSALDKMLKSKVRCQSDHPFFYYLVMNMKLKEMPKDWPMQTMAVDEACNIYYSPEFVEKISWQQLSMVLVHETLHVLFKHVTRGKNKQPDIWNICVDLSVNTILKNENFSMLSCSVVPDYDDVFKLNKGAVVVKDVSQKTPEQIYDELENKLPVQEAISLGFDEHRKIENGQGKDSQEGQGLSNKRVKELLTEAKTYAEMCGSLSNGVQKLLDGFLESKVNWRAMLQKYLQKQIKLGSSWSKPNKRFRHRGIYLPSHSKENVELTVAIDTSGSISDEHFKEFMSEILEMAKSYENVKIQMLQWDTEVMKDQTLTGTEIIEDLRPERKGYGGTTLSCVKDYFVKNSLVTPSLLIILTDGYIEYITESNVLDCDRLWVLTKHNSDEYPVKLGDPVIKLED
jgi:predicted metal-dependent peptidase